MTNIIEAWSQVLPGIRQAVTGVGVWAALNAVQPVILEEDQLIMGLPIGSTDLAGHLKMPHVKGLIEKGMSEQLGQSLAVRIIDGISLEDWEAVKRKDQEVRKLQEQAHNRAKAEIDARASWEAIYEQLNRKYASVSNKSMPQNRALFFKEAVELVAEARKNHPIQDELSERNFARCLERIAQYAELPSVFVAMKVLEKTGQL